MQQTKKGKIILSEKDIHYTVMDWVRAMTPKHPDLSMVIAYPSEGGYGKDAIIRGVLRMSLTGSSSKYQKRRGKYESFVYNRLA